MRVDRSIHQGGKPIQRNPRLPYSQFHAAEYRLSSPRPSSGQGTRTSSLDSTPASQVVTPDERQRFVDTAVTDAMLGIYHEMRTRIYATNAEEARAHKDLSEARSRIRHEMRGESHAATAEEAQAKN